ncbi:MAG TPA: EAL domain-containing protein [Rhodoferax sp.]|nr:EAL domain-containing protein [Rhodoferax sp.]
MNLPGRAVLPLRLLLVRQVGVLMAGTVLLVGACFVVFGMLPMADQIARDQFDSAGARVEGGLSAVFTPPARLLAVSHGWLAGQAPDLASPQAFNASFKPLLQEFSQLTSVVAGTSTGQGWLLLQQPGGAWRNRMTDVARWGTQRHLLIEHDAIGRVSQRWSEQIYDPRTRPWFQGAMSTPGELAVFWTAPYTFFTTGDPGITVSARSKLAGGADFVLGFDLTLRDLSKVTMGASVGMTGLALVVTDDERVLALPGAPAGVSAAEWFGRMLKPVTALGLPAASAALARWHELNRPEGAVLAYQSGGTAWLASVRPYVLGTQRLWVLVLAPKADFALAWRPIALALGLALLLVLLLASWLLRTAALRLSEPLEALALASRRIGQLDFQGVVQPPSQIAEIVALTSSQQGMLDTLRQNQQELDARAQALQQQVHALRRAETRLLEQNDQLSTIIENFPGGVLVVDADLRVLAFNVRYQTMLALPDELMKKPGLRFGDLLRFNARRGDYGPVDVEQLVAERLALVRQSLPQRSERVLASGSVIEVRRTPLPNGGFVSLYMDVTVSKKHQRELEHLAHFDALTGLPNRVLLADRLRHGMAQVARRGQRLAVAYLDLDGFKFVNDTYGHEVGDQLLLLLSGRMKQALRDGDTLARIGGDEFVAVLMELAGPSESEPLLTRLLAAADAPASLLGLELRVSASIGVSFFPQNQEVDAEQLMRQADQAMYQAKQAGKNRYQFFDAEHDLSLPGQIESLQRVRLALTGSEFVLHYQPMVNLRSAAVVGAEALIRWQHPQQGLLLPGAFLPLLEEHALAIELGRWVIDTALAQMASWLAAGTHLPVSVNVGARQLQHSGFVEDLRASLVRHPQVNPADLQLEVQEISALEDLARVTEVMAQCRAMGVHFALDDFGTGYSSLTYLKRLPVSQFKIDQSFVRDMLDDPDDLSILAGVVNVSVSFHRAVIAEGVESVAHGQLLLRLGCDLAQGFGIARPMLAGELAGWVANWQGDPLWGDVPVVSRHDQLLLFAGAEHRAWVLGLEAYLKGERQAALQHDRGDCNIGRWLADANKLSHPPGPAVVQNISLLHQQMHDLGTHLCQLKDQNQSQVALQLLPTMRQLRDELLAQIEALLSP